MVVECEHILKYSELFIISSVPEGKNLETDVNLISKVEGAGGALYSSFDAVGGVLRLLLGLVPLSDVEDWTS